jgi:hypothetical protein
LLRKPPLSPGNGAAKAEVYGLGPLNFSSSWSWEARTRAEEEPLEQLLFVIEADRQ